MGPCSVRRSGFGRRSILAGAALSAIEAQAQSLPPQGDLRVRQITSLALPTPPPDSGISPTMLEWSPDGEVLAGPVWGMRGGLLWRPLQSRHAYAAFDLHFRTDVIAFLEDGTTFIAWVSQTPPPPPGSHFLGTIYDTRTGAPIRSVPSPLPRESGSTRLLKVDAARRRAVVQQGDRGTIGLLETASWRLIASDHLTGASVGSIAISASGERVAVGAIGFFGQRYEAPPRTPTALVRVYDAAGDTLRLAAETMIEKPTDIMNDLAVSPDSQTLAAARSSISERPHDPDDRATDLDRVFLLGARDLARQGTLRWPGRATDDIAYSPSGRFLAAASLEQLMVVELATGRRWHRPIRRAQPAVAWRPVGPGEVLAYGNNQRVIVVEVES